MFEWWKQKTKNKGGEKNKRFFLWRTWRGLLLLCAKMGRIAAVEIPFCERGTIYNLVIDLFMCLHRLSLDATGHVWEANVFMALFLISQAIFFSHCILRLWRSNRYATVGFLKKKKNCLRLINDLISTLFAVLSCSFCWMTRGEGERFNFFFLPPPLHISDPLHAHSSTGSPQSDQNAAHR